jgi:hypothetical protein
LASSLSRGCHDPMRAALASLLDMRVPERVPWARLLQMAVLEASEMDSCWVVAQ